MNIPNTLSYGVQKLFLVANERLAIIRNPSDTHVGAGYTYPTGMSGFEKDKVVFLTDALGSTTVNNNWGLDINPYPLREEATMRDHDVIHATYQHYLPDTHTYTAFQLGGTINPNQSYKITITGSGNFFNFDHRDPKLPEHSSVNSGSMSIASLTAFLVHRLIYNSLKKEFPRQNLASWADIIMMTAGEFTNLINTINIYKTTPTTANYNAVLAAWNSAKTGFYTAYTTFLSNPTIASANILGSARPVVVAKSIMPEEMINWGFSDFFDDPANTLTVTQYLPLTPSAPSNLLKGYFGAGTYRTGLYHCAGKSNLYVRGEAPPYCKVLPNYEYGEVHIIYNERNQSSMMRARNYQEMSIVLYVAMQGGHNTEYYLDNGIGAPITGQINSIASFNNFVTQLTTEFPNFLH